MGERFRDSNTTDMLLGKYAQVLGTLLEVGVGFEDSVGLAVLKRSSVEKFNVKVGMRVWAGGSWGVLEEVRSVTWFALYISTKN